MKKKILSLSLALILTLSLVPAAFAAGKPVFDNKKLAENVPITATLPSLHEIYKDDFLISMPFNSLFASDTYFPVVKQHYNAVWMGNIMKPAMLSPSKGVYNFSEADRVTKVAKDAGIEMSGHTLLWHSAHASWLTHKTDGTLLSRAEALQNMTDYINTVAGHYAGTVYAWDVVNEAMRDFGGRRYDGDWKSNLRQAGSEGSPWYMAFENGADKAKGESGADYIEAAFRLARAADPNAILYYNDYSMEDQNKAAAVADMVKEINDKWLAEGNDRLLIEGVGIQGYFCIDSNFADIEKSLQLFIGIGVEISLSEMELGLFGTAAGYNGNWSRSPTEELLKKQADVYAKLMLLLKKYSEHIRRVNCSGIYIDNWTAQNYATLFDENCAPKLAYFAVADPEGYLAGNLDTEEKREAWLKGEPITPDPAEAPNLNTASSWAHDGINRAYALNILPTNLQGDYQKPCTRAEFCALAVTLIETITGSPITASKTFGDDKGDINIRKIGGLEIVTGTGGGNFSPNDPIRRADAAVILEKVARKGLNQTLTEGQASFGDISLVPYAEKAIRQMRGVSPGIMSGKDGNLFDPLGTFSREECISTMLKLWDLYGN